MSAAAIAPMRLGTMLTLQPPARTTTPPPPPPEAGGRAVVHPQLWKACAGSMCAVPPVGAAVYYFPQGHAEHEQATGGVDLRGTGVPPFVPCRVEAVRLMADPGSDDVFARISLVPLRPGEPVEDVGEALQLQAEGTSRDGREQRRPAGPGPAAMSMSSAKALTQSDANSGGGFSVLRFCALNIFPALDYSSDPPQQWIAARDVHGVEWALRHVYRGRPRRHLLTTGWSNFINSKKLRTGDSVVFVRQDDGTVHVGLRRSRRAGAGGEGPSSDGGKVPAEDVVRAATLAAAGQAFDVVQYPGAGSPEFCVRADAVRESMQVRWCPGLRFKMAFETEDLSRTSWFMGTVAGVAPADPDRWPQSPWRLLQVTWDEPELLRNVNRVCPWLLEQASSIPSLPRYTSPPRKKPRASSSSLAEGQQLFDTFFLPKPTNLPPPLPLAPHPTHGFVPSFSFLHSITAGIQGARHPHFTPFFPDLRLRNLQLCGIRPADQQQAPPKPRITTDLGIGGKATPGSGSPSPGRGAENGGAVKPPGIMLFGRAVLTEEQMKSHGVPDRDNEKAPSTSARPGSGVGVTHASCTESMRSSRWSGDEFGPEPGQCKVFAESDAVGRDLDLSALGSFEELCTRLSGMFGVKNDDDLRSHVLYRTTAGEVKHVGDEPFSAFVESARRITLY